MQPPREKVRSTEVTFSVLNMKKKRVTSQASPNSPSNASFAVLLKATLHKWRVILFITFRDRMQFVLDKHPQMLNYELGCQGAGQLVLHALLLLIIKY